MNARLIVLVTGACLLTAPAWAQHSSHGATKAPAGTASAAAAEMADGEVRRVDLAKGSILLKHGEIRSINMGAMTMAFRLQDPKLADGLKPGDKIRFAVVQKGDDLIVTRIERAR